MRMYLSFFRMRFLTLIQYRAAALAGVATQWAFGLMRILVLHAFYASSDAAQPMSFEQTVTYVWIGQAMLGALPSYADSAIMNSVLTGEVAYELTRPLDIYWMWFARTLALRTAPTLLRAVPQFVIALLLVPAPYKMALPTPAALAAWLTAATFGLLLSTAVTTLMSASTLWTVRAEGIMRFLPTLVMFFSGMYVPLRLMPAWAQLAGRLKLWLGIERDQYGEVDRASYDYVIGSKHYIVDGADFFAVDSARETVLAGCERHFGGDWYALAERYFGEIADFVTDYRPDIIGHFNLLVKHNGDGRLFDEDSPRFLDAGFRALERMAATNALLEVNTGAIPRGYRDVIYPSLKLLRRWRELGGRAIVSSDCHDARYLDAAYDRAYALLRAAGYKTAWALGAGDQLFEEYPI